MTSSAVLFVAFLVVCVAPGGLATITHRRINGDTRGHYLVELPFGFDKGGVIELRVTDLEAYGPSADVPVDLSRFGFFLAPNSRETQVATDYVNSKCYLEDEALLKLMDFSKWSSDTDRIDSKTLFAEHEKLEPGEYSLYYASCDHHVSLAFHVRIAMYNIDASGNRDYLSIGLRPLPRVYMLMFLVFSVLAMTWAKVCYVERKTVHGIHYLMFALIVLRAVVYFTLAGMYNEDSVTGSPEGWKVAYYLFSFLRDEMFFVVIVLIGTGWSHLHQHIDKNGIRLLVLIISLQVFVNVAIIILNETSPARSTFITLTDVLRIVDVICCCAILFPIAWSVKHLKEAAKLNDMAPVVVEKLKFLKHFFVLLVVYIYFTRIIVYLLENSVAHDYKWTSNLASELATLAFYLTAGLKLSPYDDNKYQKLDGDETQQLAFQK